MIDEINKFTDSETVRLNTEADAIEKKIAEGNNPRNSWRYIIQNPLKVLAAGFIMLTIVYTVQVVACS